MRRPSFLHLTVAVFALCAAFAPTIANAQDADRRARIIANLKEQTSLATMQVEVVTLEESPYGGLDHGALLVQSPNGPVEIRFLVSKDDRQLFLINGQPLDVSEDPEVRRRARADTIAPFVNSRPRKGNPEGGHVIAEFSDFQCPYCAQAVGPVAAAIAQRQDAVVLFFHMPLESIHPWARSAAIAAECAFQQNTDAFWTLHDGFYAQQQSINPENVANVSLRLLANSEINLGAWEGCHSGDNAEAHAAADARVQADIDLAIELGVQSTPTIFVNGERFRGAVPVETLIGAMK